jgi:hypothetical protein
MEYLIGSVRNSPERINSTGSGSAGGQHRYAYGHIVALTEGVGNTYIEQIKVVHYLCPLLLSRGLLDVTNEVAMGELMSIAY